MSKLNISEILIKLTQNKYKPFLKKKISMKIPCFLIGLCVSLTCSADFGVVQDKDGFVNVRAEPNTNAKIIHTLKNGDLIYCHSESIDNFYELDGTNLGENRYFVHQSRVRLIASFKKLQKFFNNDQNSLKLVGYGYEFKLTAGKFNKKWHKISLSNADQYLVQSIDGFTNFWGSDGAMPISEYLGFKMSYRGQQLDFTKKLSSDLYNPDIASSEAYYDDSTKIVYLDLINGDGAGVYHVVFAIKNGNVLSRVVVLDENV